MTPQSVPFLFDRFECRQYLGGGMTDVYRAWDTRLQREVAIKLLRDDACLDSDARERFVREAQLACRCHHENIIVTHDAGEWQGRPYMVMEFLRALTLKDMLDSGQPIGEARAVRFAYELAGALEFVHSLGIIHRDIKPANVCITGEGKVKLIDFGIAKTPDWNRTSADMAVGTLIYMAPEQLSGKPATPLMDVYSYGVLLYEILTGKRLVDAATHEHAIAQILQSTADLTLLSGVNPVLKAIVARCLEKDPQRRWPDFKTLRAAMAPLLTGAPVTSPEAAAPTITIERPAVQSRKPVVLIGAVVAVVVLAIVAAVALRHSGTAQQTTVTQTAADPSGEMVLVPGGEALIGPQKSRVSVAAFYIDRTEVTVRAYKDFCDKSSHARPDGLDAADPELPVVNVSFDDAHDFARWASKRLPTAVEWEKAARGAKGQPFPWGVQPTFAAANIPARPEERRTLEPAASRPESASPYGARQMVGNAWEWVESSALPDAIQLREAQRLSPNIQPPITASEPFYQIRGGSFAYYAPLHELHSLIHDFALMPARIRLPDVGFRCARDVR